MNRVKPGWDLGMTQLVLCAAVFLTGFANLAFFRNLLSTFGGSATGVFHVVSLALVLLCSTVLLLSLFSFRPVIRPALTSLLVLAAVSAYFMDSYNVIIDRDMLQNAAATNLAEVTDLLTPRLFAYLALLGVAPSFLVWRLPLRKDKPGPAMKNRMLVMAIALAVLVGLVAISSSFYASFVREHKHLRYYANPATPLYAAWKFTRKSLSTERLPLRAIGGDAVVPESDAHRELVVMVVGETARADHFSINGYERETNPRLAGEDVISFTDVRACGTSTEISVPCMFDARGREGFEPDTARNSENLLDVLRHAGVQVLWRDNNSDSKGVADRVPYEDFRSAALNPDCEEECRDLGMLHGLQELVDSNPNGDLLIVLHQMGSHGPAYYRRYPPSFNVFGPTCETSQLDECSQSEIVNSYDNSILYTDHFLASVIEFLRANDNRYETAMLYAGDHGESLGETGLYLHGLPYWIAPEAQLRVPLILWFGRNYQDASPDAIRNLRHEPLSHDNLFHTLLGLFEVQSEIYDPLQDILQRSRLQAGQRGEAGQAPPSGS